MNVGNWRPDVPTIICSIVFSAWADRVIWGTAALVIAYALCVGAGRLVGIAWLFAFVESGKPKADRG